MRSRSRGRELESGGVAESAEELQEQEAQRHEEEVERAAREKYEASQKNKAFSTGRGQFRSHLSRGVAGAGADAIWFGLCRWTRQCVVRHLRRLTALFISLSFRLRSSQACPAAKPAASPFSRDFPGLPCFYHVLSRSLLQYRF